LKFRTSEKNNGTFGVWSEAQKLADYISYSQNLRDNLWSFRELERGAEYSSEQVVCGWFRI
jgi:hypothetical protein